MRTNPSYLLPFPSYLFFKRITGEEDEEDGIKIPNGDPEEAEAAASANVSAYKKCMMQRYLQDATTAAATTTSALKRRRVSPALESYFFA